MKFKKETLQQYVDEINSMIETWKKEDVIKLSFSYGNMKIGRVLNISTAAIITCGNCGHCAPYCYDIKGAIRFVKNVMNARAKNTALLQKDPDEYFRQIRNKLASRKKNKYMRWHVGGEITDYHYFVEMVNIAREFPDFKFWTYTKMYNIVNLYCDLHGGRAAVPENFKVMFSEWDGTPINNPYNFPLFTVKLAAGNKNHDAAYFDKLYKCPGKCIVCINNNRGCIAGETTYNDEH